MILKFETCHPVGSAPPTETSPPLMLVASQAKFAVKELEYNYTYTQLCRDLVSVNFAGTYCAAVLLKLLCEEDVETSAVKLFLCPSVIVQRLLKSHPSY